MAEKNSLWKNIRNKAKQNRRTGATPKKPTAEMLRQERKIKAKKYAEGGETDPPYRPLSIPMEGYEPDSVFYETPSRYSEPEPFSQPEPVNKKEDKPKPTSKRSEVQDYYLNQYLNQNSFTPKPDRYVAERDASSTKLTPGMSTKEWQEGPRSFGPTLNDLDVVTDVMQLGNFVPHPLAQTIGKVGSWGGAAIDSYQALEDYDEGNYGSMAANIASAGLGAYLGAKGRGYTRDMYNTVPRSMADKIANLGSRSGSYRPLTALPKLKNNAVIQRGLNYNRGILGGIGVETIYDSKAQGGYMYDGGGNVKVGDDGTLLAPTLKEINVTDDATGWARIWQDEYNKRSGAQKTFQESWYSDQEYDPANIERRASIAADDAAAKYILDNHASRNDFTNRQEYLKSFNPYEREVIERSNYAGNFDPDMGSRFRRGLGLLMGTRSSLTNPDSDLSAEDYTNRNFLSNIGDIMSPVTYPLNLVRGAIKDTGKSALKGETASPWLDATNMALGNEEDVWKYNLEGDITLDPLNFAGTSIGRGLMDNASNFIKNKNISSFIKSNNIKNTSLPPPPQNDPFQLGVSPGNYTPQFSQLQPVNVSKYSIKNIKNKILNKSALKNTSYDKPFKDDSLYETWKKMIFGEDRDLISLQELKDAHKESIKYFKSVGAPVVTGKEHGLFIKKMFSDRMPNFNSLQFDDKGRRLIYSPTIYGTDIVPAELRHMEKFITGEGYDITKMTPQERMLMEAYAHGFDTSFNEVLRGSGQGPVSKFYLDQAQILNEGILKNKFQNSSFVRRGISSDYPVELLDPITYKPTGVTKLRSELTNNDVFMDKSFLSTSVTPSDWGPAELSELIEIPGGSIQSFAVPEAATITRFRGENEAILPSGLIRQVIHNNLHNDPQFFDWKAKFRTKILNPYKDGGAINPYMYYAGGPMYYGDGGKIWKHIGAGAYGILEGGLDTLTFGATDQLTDKGFDWLTKVGNKNLDLNDPKNAKFLRTQQQIRGYSNVAGAIGTAAFTGQWGSAIGQSAKGVNTAFQATEGLSDDFKKWSNISSQAIGIGAGLAGGSLNSAQSASKIGQAATKFGSQASKVAPYANQAMGMLGNSGQPLWQQAEARQDYLNSPEYLAMREQQNQAYVNQGLSFASHGGNINNNSLNLQNRSMRNRINKYKSGGKLEGHGIKEVSPYVGLHKNHPKKGMQLGPNSLVEGEELIQYADGGMTDANYIHPAQNNGEENIMMPQMTSDYKMITDKYGMPKFTNKSPAQWLKEKLNNRGSEFRTEIDSIAKPAGDQVKQIAEGGREIAVSINELNQQAAQEDAMRIAMADNVAAYGGYLSKYRNLNMPKLKANGGSIGDDDVIKNDRSYKVRRNMFDKIVSVEKYTDEDGSKWKIKNKYNPDTKENIKTYWVDGKFSGRTINQDEPEYIPVKQRIEFNNQPSVVYAVGGPLYGNTDSEYTYSHGGPVVSNVNQGFGLYAQNRGGMMMSQGGNMYFEGGGFDPNIIGPTDYSFHMPTGSDVIEDLPGFTFDPSVTNKVSNNALGLNNANFAFVNPAVYNNEISKIQDLPGHVPSVNVSDEAIGLNQNYSPVFNPNSPKLDFTQSDVKKYGLDPNNVNVIPDPKSTTPWYEEPWYSKAARYAPLLASAAGVATGLKNKKRKLPYRNLDTQTVNYEPERIIDREESRRRFNTFADRMKNIASSAGMLAGNLRGTLLGSNKELAGRIAESVMREENTNAQLAQQTGMAQFGANRETDALNEQMFQNAQTMALRAGQEGAMALQSGAEQERAQYLQEWLAKNRMNTRSYQLGETGDDLYVRPDGTIVDKSGNIIGNTTV